MRTSHATVLAIGMGIAGCASEGLPEGEGNPADGPEATSVADQALTYDGCRGPRPRNRGCGAPCKPCSFAVCEDGKWVYERIDWGDECSGGGGGSGGECCQVPISGGCPAECRCCTYSP